MKSRQVTFEVTTPQTLGITSLHVPTVFPGTTSFGNFIQRLKIKFKWSTEKQRRLKVKTNEEKLVVICSCQF